MADRTEIPVYQVNRIDFDPALPTHGDPDNGMFFADNAGLTWVEVENPGSNPITLGAVISADAIDAVAIPNKEITVEPGSATKFGPFPKTYYTQPDLGVYFDIDNVTYPEQGTSLLFSAYSIGS